MRSAHSLSWRSESSSPRANSAAFPLVLPPSKPGLWSVGIALRSTGPGRQPVKVGGHGHIMSERRSTTSARGCGQRVSRPHRAARPPPRRTVSSVDLRSRLRIAQTAGSRCRRDHIAMTRHSSSAIELDPRRVRIRRPRRCRRGGSGSARAGPRRTRRRAERCPEARPRTSQGRTPRSPRRSRGRPRPAPSRSMTPRAQVLSGWRSTVEQGPGELVEPRDGSLERVADGLSEVGVERQRPARRRPARRRRRRTTWPWPSRTCASACWAMTSLKQSKLWSETLPRVSTSASKMSPSVLAPSDSSTK